MASSTDEIVFTPTAPQLATAADGDGEAGAIEAIILAGGHGWGDNVLERAVCRPLVPVAGRPLILHGIDWLRRGGIKRVNICLSHNGGQIRRLLGDGSPFGVEINYYRDVMPRGPAGCVRDVARDSEGQRFLVMEGTILPQLDVRELIDLESTAVLTVVVRPARESAGANERVLEPAGLYLFSRRAFDHIPTTGYQDIKETLIPRLHISNERVDTFATDAKLVPGVSGLADYLRMSHQVVEQFARQTQLDGYRRVDGALVHDSARVDASARLVGPVQVEAEACISAGSIVVGPATIGSRSRIERHAVVSRCVLWADCVVEEGAILDQCIAIDESVVRAGRELRQTLVMPNRQSALGAEPPPGNAETGAIDRGK